MDENPFGLFITWTCYGTWIPGDTRGFVSHQRLPGGGIIPKINTPTVPPHRDDPYSRTVARNLQKHESKRLSSDQAIVVADSLIDACRVRGWRLLRGAIMRNHVHNVVVDCPDDGPGVRRVLKGVSQTDLPDAAQSSRRWWTKGGSNRYLHGHESIANAVHYVATQQYVLVKIDDMVIRPGNCQ